MAGQVNLIFPTHRARILIWAGLAAILAAPLVAMQLTSEVNWDGSDFVFAGLLLAMIGIAYEVATRMKSGAVAKWAVVTLVIGVVLMIWAHAAVGIF